MIKLFSFLFLLQLSSPVFGQGNIIPLDQKGFIPVWNVAGPFEQPMFGFGVPVDKDAINEKTVNPVPGKIEKNALSKNGEVIWQPQSISSNGFLDFNKSIRWTLPDKGPEKIWYSITGYASAVIYSESERQVLLKYGSNDIGKILLNGEIIFSTDKIRPALLDEDEIKAQLKKGENLILVKTGNSHRNHGLDFFGTNKWEWGFYLRIVNPSGKELQNVSEVLLERSPDPAFDLISTFYFKKESGKLLQRFDLELISYDYQMEQGKLDINVEGTDYSFTLDSIRYGLNRFNIFIPEIQSEKKVNAELSLSNKKFSKLVSLSPSRHYQLHVMMLSHMDIGYTNPQPVVKEIHASAIDDVLEMCEKYPEFKWTIETLWQLEQYELSRPTAQFKKVIKLIKEGRISVNPLYANPFTGWVGEEEMIRSLDKAKEYKEKYGLEYTAAVYNDIPGQSWALPQVLNGAGVNFLAEGLNELFNDYSFQRSLPKAFIWEGSDGSKVLTYRNEGYGEGRSYGLEKKGNFAVEQRLWEKLNRLAGQGFDYDMVLLNSAFMDNSSIPVDQFLSMQEWNKEYEYPKFISSNAAEFAKLFSEKYGKTLPIINGDWTSNWDSYAQGEPDKMKQERWIQHNLLSAEKISALNSILDSSKFNYENDINDTYSSLLNFSGHGSGLEYGYGSPEDNKITMEYRQDYLTDAYLDTEGILRRGIYRITKPQESFEGQGILVFNPLSWIRNTPVQINFTAESKEDYEVIDPLTNNTVPSFREDHKLIFIAENLPSFGYKKYQLKPVLKEVNIKTAGILSAPNSIENQFYKITYNATSGDIKGIVDKKTGKELINNGNELGFNLPIVEKSPGAYSKIKNRKAEVSVKNQNPVRVILEIKRPGELLETTEYTLWNTLDRIDVQHTFNLELLKTTITLEQYGAAFPFNLKNQKTMIELLGGFLDPEQDIISGRSKDAFSIRRTVGLFNNDQAVTWSSLDARILQLRGTNENRTIVSNIVNNFPKDWNRNEENKGKIFFRYSFTSQKGTFDPSFTSRFGWELSTPPLVKASWYKKDPILKSYLKIDNDNVMMMNFSYSGNDKFLIRVLNVNDKENTEAVLSSELFKNYEAYSADYLGVKSSEIQMVNESFKMNLKPNEIKTIILQNKNNQ